MVGLYSHLPYLRQGDKMSYSIYMHINKTNGKVYVGLTSMRPEERWRDGKGYHKGTCNR